MEFFRCLGSLVVRVGKVDTLELISTKTVTKAVEAGGGVEAESTEGGVVVNLVILLRGFVVLHALVGFEVADVANRLLLGHLLAEHVTALVQFLGGFSALAPHLGLLLLELDVRDDGAV